MKKLSIFAIALAMTTTSLFAQDVVKVGPYDFTKIVDNQATSVKDQNRSGTCWAFSGIAAIESDIIKAKGDKFAKLDLSEMWIARNSYYDKFVKYVRYHGSMNFAEGGSFGDVIDVCSRYGVVPEEAYKGLNYGYDAPVFGELWEALKGYADGIIKNKDKKLSTAWKAGFNGILDAYFGVRPEKFTYEGKEYTPKSFAEYIGFKKSDYISFCSFTHVPYGEMHIIEVPDNWIQEASMNVSFEDFAEIQKEVLTNGYTSAWGADVSEKGFAHGEGLCTLPTSDAKEMAGSERAKWEKLSAAEKKESKGRAIEKEVTAENRQAEYDNYLTTDDHGMQITGMFKDQDGKVFFKVKNSWADDSNKFGGYFYASEPFFKAKTLNFMVHKNALSNKTKKKYNIK